MGRTLKLAISLQNALQACEHINVPTHIINTCLQDDLPSSSLIT